MTLYSDFETDISYAYLQEIITSLEEPICVLGGWAVYLIVNKYFQKEQGRNYLGSKDIDIGFHIDTNLDRVLLKNSTLGKAIQVLESHSFQPLGFRFYKAIHAETREELTEDQAAKTPTHDIFQIYVDPIVDAIHPSFKEVFGFDPIDEPLLQLVYKNNRYRLEFTAFDKVLWLPTPEILLATKIKSLATRTKDEKLIKDICDIYALSWYSGEKFNDLTRKTHKIIDTQDEKPMFKLPSTEAFEKAELAIEIDAETIRNVFEQFLNKNL